MSEPQPSVPVAASRESRIEALMADLRPQVEAAVRRLVERAVDVPEHEEFGAIEYEFRDAGVRLATDVRQAALAGRKKRGTSDRACRAGSATGSPSSTPTSGGGC
jgi:hypothetical protein